jgi:hypothetical protein
LDLKAGVLCVVRSVRDACQDPVFCSQVGTEPDHHDVRRAFIKFTAAAEAGTGLSCSAVSCRPA